ncbi:flagellar hook-basal body complex protein FliE [Mobilitalea sibirica]|uniref:Flagellar hook-basal body complex protein FliE n=1 Tax=Mobilitalea sibirica TaxID=1462919 RepID=A0A8J7KXN0_9FIRM|nr:flagellar hook-basal body complex protein FliE [Mobilitalea sibirica]MBH1941982.1 flagellar hook-basal body complex protein FliE [Mobilitalea sibirica]
MNIASVGNLSEFSKYGIDSATKAKENRNATFESLFQAAVGLVKETNNYANAAEEAEMAFSLGLMDNTHDLQVAQQKANLSLQYTVAIRNGVMDAYKEIMALQF